MEIVFGGLDFKLVRDVGWVADVLDGYCDNAACHVDSKLKYPSSVYIIILFLPNARK
jgi:hypothetical protein